MLWHDIKTPQAGSSQQPRPIVAHTGSYLFLKMEASRVPCTRSGTNSRYGDTVASVRTGDDRSTFLHRVRIFWCLFVLNPNFGGNVFASLPEVGIYSLRCTRTVGTVPAPDAPRRVGGGSGKLWEAELA